MAQSYGKIRAIKSEYAQIRVIKPIIYTAKYR